MAGRDLRHGRRGMLGAELLALCVLALAFVSFEVDLGRRLGISGPVGSPAAIAPPEGVTLPELAEPAPVAAPLTGGATSAAAVQAALAPLLKDPKLGPHLVVSVGTVEGTPVFDNGAGLMVPASLTKIPTAAAALASLGPDHRFATRVVDAGPGRVVLVGGGDPYLTAAPPTKPSYPPPADLRTLARDTAQALRAQGRTTTALAFDDSLFSGPRFNAAWPPDYAADVVPPISALWVDQGRRRDKKPGFEADPALAAAYAFAAELNAAGVRVTGAPARAQAPSGADEVAAVESPTVRQVVDQVLLVSDNEGAELLAHHVGLAEGFGGTFEGAAKGVRAVLAELGVALGAQEVLHDGSGLSRHNRLAASTLLRILALGTVESRPLLRNVVSGLPVAAFNGSLGGRFEKSAPAGRGRVAAKTGTLTGVSGLAGVATDLDGSLMLFVVVADQVRLPDTLAARDALDRIAGALGACHCSGAAAGTTTPSP